MVKKILIALLVILVIIQFIRPEKNTSAEVITAGDISKVHAVPENVHQLLVKKCYDCHSNNTKYPWYVNISCSMRFLCLNKIEVNNPIDRTCMTLLLLEKQIDSSTAHLRFILLDVGELRRRKGRIW
mgnify:CR=1 FL=1